MIFPFSIEGNASIRNVGGIEVRICGRSLVVALLAIGCHGLASAKAQEKVSAMSSPSSAEATSHQPLLVGVASCTSAGCHGGGQASQVVGSEYNIWIAQDPHARAYSTLFEERSQQIVRLLDNLPADVAAAPQQNDRCLVCHSMAGTEPRDPRLDVISDGVGCEACHGPADRWVSRHYEHRLSAAEREQLGLWETDRLVARTQICVRCHVGSAGKGKYPARDVNHELIAAGHPRLQFEMSAYLEAMPKHWVVTPNRVEARDDFDALAWAVGQACASQAAMEQLASRAGKNKIWPEFSEWSCGACHHNLRGDAQRQADLATAGGPSQGLIEWDTWNHFVTRSHAVDVSRAFGLNIDSGTRVQTATRQLATEMRRLSPDRKKVAELAHRTARELGGWAVEIENSRIIAPQVDRLTRTILQDPFNAGMSDWASAAQIYDALASLHETRLRQAHADAHLPAVDQLTPSITRLYMDLAKQFTSPRDYVFQRKAVQQQMDELSKLVPVRETDQ